MDYGFDSVGVWISWSLRGLRSLSPALEQLSMLRIEWERSESLEVNAWIGSFPLTFEGWDLLMSLCEGHLVGEGRAILRYQDKMVGSGKSDRWVVGGVGVLNITGLISETGDAICNSLGVAVAVMYFRGLEGRWIYSLRSKSGGVDVCVIAARYGGGGHPRAAGFTFDLLLF